MIAKSSAMAAAGIAIAIGLVGMPGAAEEIRIGFIAPITGPFAQAGKDMVNGWEMYTDEVKNDFAGATIKFILEDDQAKPPGRPQGREADPPGQGAYHHGRRAGLDRIRAGAGQHAREDSVHRACHGGG